MWLPTPSSHRAKVSEPNSQNPSAVYKIHWQPLFVFFFFHRHSTESLDNNRNIYIFLNNFKRRIRLHGVNDNWQNGLIKRGRCISSFVLARWRQNLHLIQTPCTRSHRWRYMTFVRNYIDITSDILNTTAEGCGWSTLSSLICYLLGEYWPDKMWCLRLRGIQHAEMNLCQQ